jgi:hypothetical protein
MGTNLASPIFISYASIDRKIAETICDALQARGLPCWISCRDIGPGENFQEAIVAAIRSARVMLLVFTSNANNSDEIKKEIVLAGHNHVTVIPVRVEDVVPNDALAYEFATRQWVDLFRDWEREIDRLAAQVSGVNAMAGTTASAHETKPASSSHRKNSGRRVAIVAPLAVAALAVAGLAGYWKFRPAPLAASPPVASPAEHASAPASPVNESQPQPVAAPNAAAPAPSLSAPPAPAQAAPAVAPPPESAGPFDGIWQTTMDCPALPRLGRLTFALTGEIKGGAFHATRGFSGKPGWLIIDGKVRETGAVALTADGIIGRDNVAPAPKGTPYNYRIAGMLKGSKGNGHRLGGRQCDFAFEKLE